MRRCDRRDMVVTFMEVKVEEDLVVDPVLETVTDFPFGKIHFVDDISEDLRTVFRHGFGDPSACIGAEYGGAPNQECVIWEKSLCSMGSNLEQYGG